MGGERDGEEDEEKDGGEDGEEDGLREMGRKKASLPKPGKQARSSTAERQGPEGRARPFSLLLETPRTKEVF